MKHIKYTRELLESAVKKSHSIAGVIREFNMIFSGGTHGHISKKIKQFNIDTTHFTGRAWNKNAPSRNKRKWQDVLVLRDRLYKENVHALRQALIESGRTYKCAECGVSTIWNNKPLCVQIDHINGNSIDNRPDNLRFLCPNCHSQTENYGVQKTKFIRHTIKKCLRCNNDFHYNVHRRKYCSVKCSNRINKSRSTKIYWPSIIDLQEMIKNTNYCQVAKKLGVSDNAIRKHLKKFTATVV